jgi:hypothetical protein
MLNDREDLNYNNEITIGFNVIGGIVVLFLIFTMIFVGMRTNSSKYVESVLSSKSVYHKCIIPNFYYPEIQEVVDNKNTIIDELSNIIINENWSTWGASYNQTQLTDVPRFSDMNKFDKIKYLLTNTTRLGNEERWKIFGLIIEKEPIVENVYKCPKTYDFVKSIPGLINAGFSCLEPHSKTPYHNDTDDRFYRVHIPLIIPDVSDDDIRLDVYDDKKQLIKLNWKTNYFVFNDNCFHQAFNNTDRHRIVLLLDIERRI